MSRILSVGVLKDLLQIRNDALKRAGFEVSSCAGAAHAKWLFRKHRHEVVVIGHGVPIQERNQLAAYVKKTSPQTKIAFLYLAKIEQAQMADAIVNVEEGPEYLVQTIQYLLSKPVPETRTTSENDLSKLEGSMPELLCICATESALVLRKKALQDAGHKVSGAISLKEVEAACTEKTFGLIVVGPQIGPRMKMTLAEFLQRHCPSVPILEIGRAKPEIQGAGCIVGDSQLELLQAVRMILYQEAEKEVSVRTCP